MNIINVHIHVQYTMHNIIIDVNIVPLECIHAIQVIKYSQLQLCINGVWVLLLNLAEKQIALE